MKMSRDKALQIYKKGLDLSGVELNLFLESLGLSEKSEEAYKKSLRRFEEWHFKQEKKYNFKGLPSSEHELNAYINQFIKYLEQKGYSASTINLHLSPLRKLVTYLVEGNNKDKSKTKLDLKLDIRNKKTGNDFVKEPITPEDIAHLLDFKSKTIQDRRNKAIMALMVTTGIRQIEVSRAKVGDLTYKSDRGVRFRVLKVQGKGRGIKDRFVVVTDEVYPYIEFYLNKRGKVNKEDYLFVSHSDRPINIKNGKPQQLSTRTIRKAVVDKLTASGLYGNFITTHSLRHSAATNAHDNGADILRIQLMLGHSSSKMTERYLKKANRLVNPAELSVPFLTPRKLNQRKRARLKKLNPC